jgi:hypothetical protein
MELKGKIILIGETESVGTSGFTKRLLVLETLETYPQKLPIEFVKDKTTLLDGKSIGQEATVSINLRGSEYNGKYYSQINGWKIEVKDNF